jgi:hypothetical protein
MAIPGKPSARLTHLLWGLTHHLKLITAQRSLRFSILKETPTAPILIAGQGESQSYLERSFWDATLGFFLYPTGTPYPWGRVSRAFLSFSTFQPSPCPKSIHHRIDPDYAEEPEEDPKRREVFVLDAFHDDQGISG